MREEKEFSQQECRRIEEEYRRLVEKIELNELEKEMIKKENIKILEQQEKQEREKEENEKEESLPPPFRRDNINIGKTAPTLENVLKKLRSLSDHVTNLE